jgi:polyisoprenoid-binding protein YceI
MAVRRDRKVSAVGAPVLLISSFDAHRIPQGEIIVTKANIAPLRESDAGHVSAQTGSVEDFAQAEGGAFAVEPLHTRVLFSVSHFGFTTYYGEFSGVSGSLDLDPKNPSGSALNIQIPVASIGTTSAELNSELKDEQWFDTIKYPNISFKATKVTTTGPGKADIVGALTLHGTTKPIVLHAVFHGAGVNPLNKRYTVGFDASAKIKRTEFGVSTLVPLISDDVDIIISAAFERQS